MPIIDSFAPLSLCKKVSSFWEMCEMVNRSHARLTCCALDEFYCRSLTELLDYMHSAGGHTFMYNMCASSYSVV